MNQSSSQDGGLGLIGEEAVGGKGLLNKAANNKRRDLDDMGRRVKEKEREGKKRETCSNTFNGILQVK